MPAQTNSRSGILAVGIFLVFAATAAFYAGVTLLFPGTILDRAWALNPHAHRQLASLGRTIAVPFFVLAAALALATIGWFRHRLWAWRLTVVIVATQIVGDALNLLSGDLLRGAIGLLIASALLIYLFRPSIKFAFEGTPSA
jgi:hypothetical protein